MITEDVEGECGSYDSLVLRMYQIAGLQAFGFNNREGELSVERNLMHIAVEELQIVRIGLETQDERPREALYYLGRESC